MNMQAIPLSFSCVVVVTLALSTFAWSCRQSYVRKLAQRLRIQTELEAEIRFAVFARIDDAMNYCRGDMTVSRAQLFDRSTAMNFVPPLKPGLSGGDSADFVANQLRSSLGHIIAAESQLCFGNFTLAAERLRHADANIRSARQYSASH